MTRRFIVPIGLLSLASDPTGTFAGETYYNTTLDKIRVYDGLDWQDAGVSATELADALQGATLSSTDDLTEGTTNKYFSVQRVNDALNSGTLQNISFTYNAGAIDVSVPIIQGPAGAQGTIGGTGLQGPEGPPGPEGAQGVMGVQGIEGMQGSVGAPGSQGAQGATGAQGANGSDGAQGAQGPEGVQGATGTSGAQGATGIQGTDGLQGAIGAQGATGAQGTSGADGAQGTQGIQGYAGADGNSSSYYNYKIKTGQTSGDPGNGGFILYDNATQTSATQLTIDHLTSTDVDIDIFLALLKAGDTLVIQDAANSDNYQQWSVNGAETLYPNNYAEVPVTLVASAGTGTTGFSNNHDVILVIVAAGVQGPTGAQGPTGLQGVQGIQGATGTISPDDAFYYALIF